MDAVKLSILIPTYTRAKLLSQTLDSVLAQGSYLKDCEIIISNDASKDTTQLTLDTFKAANPNLNIRIFNHEKNLGGPGNWTFLLSEAKGEYVFLLSDDDWIAPDFLKRYLEILTQYPKIDVVYSAFEYRDGNMQLLQTDNLFSTPGLVSGVERLKNQLRANHMVMSSMYCTETLRAAGGWQAKYGVHLDGAAFALSALRSKNIFFIDTPLFYFRIGGESWSTFKVEKQKQMYGFYRNLIDDLIEQAKTLNPDLVPFLKTAYALHAQGVLNALDIKCAHQNISQVDLRKLLIDLVTISPEAYTLASFYKLWLVSIFGNGWLKSLRKILNKPDIKNSSVFERTGP